MANIPFCRIEVGIDALDTYKMAEFWSKALGYQVGDLDSAGIYLDLVPPKKSMPVVFIQKVPDKSKGKNSFHLDIYVKNLEAKVNELLELGASRKGEIETGSEGGLWQIMLDIEGNEFCVCLDETQIF
jgi:predicted enzyme related to lactoylglutathione lyase